MGVLWNIGAFQYRGGASVSAASATVKHLAQGVDARGGQVVQEIAGPFACAATFFGEGGSAGFKTGGARVVNVANIGTEIAVVIYVDGLVADIQYPITIQIGGIIIGFVIEFVVSAHGHQCERRS